MIHNLLPRAELIGQARKNAKRQDTKRVPTPMIDSAISEGWRVKKKRRKSATLVRDKRKSDLLEARAWTLFYRMGFQYLSGKNGCKLSLGEGEKGPSDQIDVVAADTEVALAVECKSAENPRKDASLPDWLSRFGEMKKRFSTGLKSVIPAAGKRHVGMVVFTWDIILTENDRQRADEHGVILFDQGDLEYFEALVGHLGPAARYQFLCEIFRGKQIEGLEVRVPALRTKMGRNVCYTFSVRPEYLLKIGYVAHRAKGKAIDVDMYQRMISKGRLKAISAFISDGGSFPTNIVVNIRERRYAEFQRGEQKENSEDGSLFGWLVLRPAYGCAWIIDGQHRLFAYSGHDRATKDHLNVLAYEALSSSDQAQMFVDINSEQRKVKRSLLVELNADLKWTAEEEDDRIQAIISKAGLSLDSDLDSPLRHRILLSDVKRTDARCISLTSISQALDQRGLFIVSKKKDHTEYGPLWRSEPQAALKRTLHIVKAWFSPIADSASEWWKLGAGEGGGLAMNNGVTVCLNVMKSVMEHIGFPKLAVADADDVAARLAPFAKSLGSYFARMSAEERQRFRQLQGSDGQLMGTRQCQEALHAEFPQFSPPQLSDWMESRKKNYNEKGRVIIEDVETTLQKYVLQILKGEFDSQPESWWWDGVPKPVRKKVDDRMNESDGKSGGREQNFDLIHYREIISHHWDLFKEIFGYAASGNSKEKQTSWIVDVGEMRNIVMHPSRQQFLTPDKLALLQTYSEWLKTRIQLLETGVDAIPSEHSSDD